MSYRNIPEIYDEDGEDVFAWLFRVLAFCGYGVVLVWLWGETDYPGSFGMDFGHGRGAALENFYYSYILLQRHTLLDVVTFAWMWAPVVGFIAWLALDGRKNRQAKHASATNFNSSSNSVSE